MLVNYEKLQNGSDIRGIAIDTYEKKANLNSQVAKFIAYGFVKLLENKININSENLKIAIVIDSRLSGPNLKKCYY